MWGKGHIWKQSIQTSALQTSVSSKTGKQYREMEQQVFFSTLLSYLVCMCMCAALQQVGDATHKIAALFYCVGVTVSPMTVSQKVLGRLCVRGVTMQPAAGQEQQAPD